MDVNHLERFVSFLPLSHIAAQIIDLHAPMYLGATTYFAQPDALKGSLTSTLKDAKPTIFFGVPRVWEKIQEKMVQIGRETTGLKKSIATWCKELAAEKNRLAQYGNAGGAPCGYGCANSLVLTKIKEALGLECTKGCFTAAAPIAPETLFYFATLDIPVYEVFGQSECTGPQTISYAGCWKIGYCGRPMLGTQTKIDEETNELCYRGRHVFMGYMHMPEKTAETIDSEGYLHSGDISEFDDNHIPEVPKPSGFMRITGRIKELIITAGGENVPPVLIENEVKAACVAISNVMVVGDRRKYLAMVVSLKCEIDAETAQPTDKLATDSLFIGEQIGSSATTMTEAAADPLWTKCIDDAMKIANSKTTSNAQIVQKWKMLPIDFSEKAGDLTPTLKLKRSVVCEKYSHLLDDLYA
jgi:long-chain-fatty-acid--CoA ligase ACSBG